ncbi:MAG: hypothetical protein LUH56_01050 [Oscillospiraceae bacterium]|nr:hypothetical protein [Oscillospiraceae bacterium]
MNEIMISQSAEIVKQVTDTTVNIVTKGFDYAINTICQSENISAIGKTVGIGIATVAFVNLSIYVGTHFHAICETSATVPQQ